MANLRDIRNRISSVNNTQQITKAMKMVAAAKLKKAQDRMTQTRPYAAKIEEVAGRLAGSTKADHPVMRKPDEINEVLFVVVGSDRGLRGGFNNNLFKEVESRLHEEFQSHLDDKSLSMITIGKKATAHFTKRKYKVIESHPGFFDDLDYSSTSDIMNAIIKEFSDEKFDEVYIAFNEFKSVIAQKRRIQKILPIDPEKIAKSETEDAKEQVIDYLYEPDSQAILNRLLPLHLNMQLWRAVLESNASEQGARMTAMDSATENAKDLEKELRLEYNQARQSAITTEISEIVSGAQALSED
ncbi:ATP synthase F1 subunit gamma [Gracilimonas mengyeensis]|uniref:ATP synthase gamma chain n=1 Tax=Gracilimonas mengyeensis TaxID=1302730 RepID=A0A521ABJ1_9BACT|nr:ATP synthase F1 subunit gamma [Gracilimonas mengyeensis]SMO32189.1 ATP synthase F1 subcomplex gamma subunit [Gracilimonas mengyeensis]